MSSTGRMRPHDRADRMTKTASATPAACCPTWMRFRSGLIAVAMPSCSPHGTVFGYCLIVSSSTPFFLYGTGANGKSVSNTLFTLLGDYAANAPMDTFMETRVPAPDRSAGPRGSRFVGATETEQGRCWNESKIKEITGGDRVSARFMRQDFFTYVPQFAGDRRQP